MHLLKMALLCLVRFCGWVIIDDTLYHCGHSVKDLGKKLSAIMRMDWDPETVLKEVR